MISTPGDLFVQATVKSYRIYVTFSINFREVVSVLTGDLSSTYVRVLQYFRESIGKMADTVAVKI